MVARGSVPRMSIEPQAPPRPPFGARILGWVGVLTHLVIGAFPFAVSGLMLANGPLYAVWAVWGVGVPVAFALRRRRPELTPFVPIVSLAIWFAVVSKYDTL